MKENQQNSYRQAALLRVNNEKIRNILTKLGVEVCECAKFEESCWLSFDNSPALPFHVHGIGYYEDDAFNGIDSQETACKRYLDDIRESEVPFVDCGTNVNLFIAIATLDERKKANQWYIVEHNIQKGKKKYANCVYVHDEAILPTLEKPRKATVFDLIEFFTNDAIIKQDVYSDLLKSLEID